MRSFYTTHDAARLLGVSLPTVVNWIAARRLRAHRTPGGHRRISREDLAAFMVRHGMPLPEELYGAAPARRKVLVLGEAGPAREGLVRQLAAAGYAPEQASPGFAAGAAAARFEPELVVVCPTSPDCGDLVTALRSDRELAAVPVIALGRTDWVGAPAAAGCDSFLARPLSDGALVSAVERLLAHTAARPRGRRR
jgi:excisionase family DNA binding protein